jgi:CubicO group peptidase (beta-lactamase class C family)
MTHRVFLGILCLALAFASGSARADGLAARLDPVIRAAMENWQVPGLAVAVVRDGETVLIRGYGRRDVESGAPVAPETAFALGSITKTMTALGLALLADEGRIAWDAPASRYLPALRFHDAALTEAATLRDLMSHRSGMARHDALWYLDAFGRDELIHRLRHLPASAPLRTIYQYNNLMVAVAGTAAGAVAGTGWEDFIAERLLHPLGMTGTTLSVGAFRALPGRASGYFPASAGREPIPLRDTDPVAPAAGAYAPVTDAAKLLRLLVRDGVADDGTRLVSPEAVNELRRRAMLRPDISRAKEFRVTGYGIGLYVGTFRDAPMHWHWGAIDGYGGMLSFRPGTGSGVAVLTNLSGHNPVPTMISLAIYDALDGRDPAPWIERYGARPPPTAPPPHVCPATGGPAYPPDDYAGRYAHPAYGEARILTTPDDALMLHTHGRAVPLEPCGGDAWMVRETNWPIREGLLVRFRRDGAGQIGSLDAAIADGPTYRLNPGPLTFVRQGIAR